MMVSGLSVNSFYDCYRCALGSYLLLDTLLTILQITSLSLTF